MKALQVNYNHGAATLRKSALLGAYNTILDGQAVPYAVNKHGSRAKHPYLGRYLKMAGRHNLDTAVSVRLEKNRLLINLNHRNGRLNLVPEWWYQQAERLSKL